MKIHLKWAVQPPAVGKPEWLLLRVNTCKMPSARSEATVTGSDRPFKALCPFKQIMDNDAYGGFT